MWHEDVSGTAAAAATTAADNSVFEMALSLLL
jgi:hypothetical protein